jgi:hypothetical protein
MRILFAVMMICSAAGAQVYTNAAVNAKYTPPAGWVMDPPLTSPSGTVQIKATRVGLQPVYINFDKHALPSEAFLYRAYFSFFQMTSFYKAGSTSTTSPSLNEIGDTTIGVAKHSFFTLTQADQNVTLVVFTSSYQTYTQSLSFITTPIDYRTNANLYFANWMNTEYLSLAPVATRSVPGQRESKVMLFDLLGRERKAGAVAPRIKAFPLPRR